MKLEEYLDEEFKLLGVTPHITHLKGPGYYSRITIAIRRKEPYIVLQKTLAVTFARYFKARRSDIGAFVINELAERGAGVALCHHLDQFNRERGRIIAKGRLLKAMREERFKQ